LASDLQLKKQLRKDIREEIRVAIVAIREKTKNPNHKKVLVVLSINQKD